MKAKEQGLPMQRGSRVMLVITCLWCCGSARVAVASAGETMPWQWEALADAIVVATVSADDTAPRHGEYPLEVRAIVQHTLKGAVPSEFTFHVTACPYCGPGYPSFTLYAALRSRRPAPQLLFLQHPLNATGPLALIQWRHKPLAVVSAQASAIAEATRLLSDHRALLQTPLISSDAAMNRTVQLLIHQLRAPAACIDCVFRQLFTLYETNGVPAVAAVIAHLDDRRSIRRRLVDLQPGDHCGTPEDEPRVVLEVLAASLSAWTNEDFRCPLGPDDPRSPAIYQRCVDGWNLYARH